MNLTAAQNLLSVYNIPLEENWQEYLGRNHYNYYRYFQDLKIAPAFQDSYSTVRFTLQNKGMTIFINKISSFFEVSQMKNKQIADVGCGWGFISFLFLLNGASRVYAIGFPYQIKFIQRLYEAARKRNLIPHGSELIPLTKPIEEGDETLGNNLRSELDYVIFHDVFEHIHDDIFEYALKATFNSLRNGGKIISATHNTDNPLVLERTRTYWNRLESEYISDYRKKLILKHFPEIKPADCEAFLRGTQGMTMKSFNTAVTAYQEKKILPAASELKPAVDLEYDYICENYISPGKIIQQLKNAGFINCFCYPQLRHSRRFMLLWPFEKLLSGMMMQVNALSQSVVFYGEKPLK